METFGDRLKAVRQQAGLTQEQLAEMSGVSLGAVREYEQHKRDPLLSNAVKLARALKQPLETFLSREGEDAGPVKAKGGRRQQTDGGRASASTKRRRKGPADA